MAHDFGVVSETTYLRLRRLSIVLFSNIALVLTFKTMAILS